MLYKEIPCPICNGQGYTTYGTECSIFSKPCDNCLRTGMIAAEITNGDLIRSCNNEQLTRVYANLKKWAIYSGGENSRLLDDSPEDFLLWLNKETDKTDLFTIFPFINIDDYKHPYFAAEQSDKSSVL